MRMSRGVPPALVAGLDLAIKLSFCQDSWLAEARRALGMRLASLTAKRILECDGIQRRESVLVINGITAMRLVAGAALFVQRACFDFDRPPGLYTGDISSGVGGERERGKRKG